METFKRELIFTCRQQQVYEMAGCILSFKVLSFNQRLALADNLAFQIPATSQTQAL
jgi:hypothetical protein